MRDSFVSFPFQLQSVGLSCLCQITHAFLSEAANPSLDLSVMKSDYCAYVKKKIACTFLSGAANPSLDFSVMKSDFKCNNWIVSVMHMFG